FPSHAAIEAGFSFPDRPNPPLTPLANSPAPFSHIRHPPLCGQALSVPTYDLSHRNMRRGIKYVKMFDHPKPSQRLNLEKKPLCLSSGSIGTASPCMRRAMLR